MIYSSPLAAVEKPPVPAEAAAAAAAAAAAEWVPGQLTVRRLPRTDIDALMLGGVKEMDVIWHSAAEAAEAMRNAGDGPWKVLGLQLHWSMLRRTA